jgi:hypothetical protein
MQEFERLSLYATVQKPPPVKFTDLEALVQTRISFNLLPFDLRLDYLRVTEGTTLVPITIAVHKKDLTFQLEEELHQSTVNIFGRITTLTGRIVQTFEDVISLSIPPSLFEENLKEAALYQKAVPLRPGLYKLNLVLKDLNSGNVGTLERRLAVPVYEENQLAHSTLILADRIERVPSNSVGRGQFVIGDLKVRPTLKEEFARSDRMGIYMQVYNLGVGEETHKSDATIDYVIKQGEKAVFNYTESNADLGETGDQITLEKVLPLTAFEPGNYELQITVTDRVSQQTVQPAASFRIRR